MAHLSTYLPTELELGAVETTDWGTEVVSTDGGHEVRNNRWAAPKRTFEVAFPPSLRDGTVYQAVKDLYANAHGKLHTFNFRPWTDEGGTVLTVRFDSSLQIEGLATHLDKIATFTLVEVTT